MSEMTNNPAVNKEEVLDLTEQARVRREKLDQLKAEGKNPYIITKFERTSNAQEIADNFEAMENQTVRLAGRIMTWRNMGKATFVDLHDQTGRMQLYIRINDIGEEQYAAFNTWDIGDIIGVEGFVFRTRRGEISVHVKSIELLSKALLPLPDKWHGLKDTEMRFRQRYVDLIVNPDVKRNFVIRSKFIKYMRQYLDNMNYIEVETPVLNTIAGGAAARPFITHHNTLDIDMYMRIATELPLKRLIVGGMDRVYEIGRIFRNEGMDPKHNPEFTSVELYQAYADFHDMMDIAEGIISGAAKEILGTYEVEWM
ncbi:MAG: lysine--tRNA ligase, partial [Oscillospiraceae bacterium]|nr:lysine--tRNA ligase [Oscillospiraceae bacterium]